MAGGEGPPGGGRGVHLEDPTGGGGGPRGLVPRPLQWLGDLPQHSPSVREERGGGGGAGRGAAVWSAVCT